MAAATVQVQINTGAGPTVGSAEGGIRFNLEDSVNGTTNPITIPSSTGTAYSWYKTLHFQVTGTGTTTMANRGVRLASGITTGLHLYFKDGGAAYTQASGANKPADVGTADTVPAGYTELTTNHQNWHTAGVLTNSAARNGNFVVMAFGVSNNYAGGGGDTALPNLTFQYDEY